METAYLCKCLNCDTVMIDQNPQTGAILKPLVGGEVDMQFIQGLVENKDDNIFWGCPVCLTDDHLIDL